MPVSGSLGRTWTITETVPISHANLDVALSTLAKESGGNLATLTGKDFATQATLALIKAKTDNLDAALSTLATATGQSTTQPRNLTQIGGTLLTGRDWSVDFSKLDVALSTLAKESGGNLATLTAKDFATQATLALIKTKTDNLDILLSTLATAAGQSATQPRNLSQYLGSAVGLTNPVHSQTVFGGAVIDPRAIRTLTTTDAVEARVGSSIKTLLFAPIDVAASGDNTIVALDASNKIKVSDYSIVCDAAVTVRWKSGASTNLSGAMSFAANGGIMAAAGAGRWLFETAVNQALVLNLGAGVGARGHVTYFKESS